MFRTFKYITVLSLFASSSSFANSLTLSSHDIAHGELMSKEQEFNGFGCNGSDLSPHLKWSNAPKETKSFAITAYDPDAPTGSGWWHWQMVNISKNTMEIATGEGSSNKALSLEGSQQMSNDYGVKAYGGACPPSGHGVHRYRFTIHALSVDKLDLPENASGALTGYMINANTIASSTIESLYKRD